MQQFIDYVKKNTTIKVENVFEIGANYGQDAEYLMNAFKIPPQKVYAFEANPEAYEAIKKLHRFNAYNFAVFNEEKEITFYVYPENDGWSGIYGGKETNLSGREITVKSIRMDNFLTANKIESVDFLKLDVEGASYPVLDGFGDEIKKVKALHVEAEHEKFHEMPDHLYGDISALLCGKGFELVYFHRFNDNRQSDSFWIKKEYLKTEGGENIWVV
jgi:FkbM family methyltransferase